MKRVTIKDLSKYLALSTSTISRAFVDDKHIHPETKRVVLEAAKKLGYRPNPMALSLKYGKSKNIGFVVPEMTTPFSSTVLRGVENIFYPLGYRVIIMQSEEDPEIERKNLLLLEAFNVDGIIINLCHDTYNEGTYRHMMERGIPMVFFDRIPPDNLDVSKVLVNDNIKAALMVEHLISIGRRKIVHLRGPSSIRNAEERVSGYRRILAKYELFDPKLLVEPKGMLFQHGREAAKTLLDKNIAFDSIFAFTDTLAIGAMNYLLEKGYRIPEQVALASFSGTEMATIVHPPLSNVQQPLIEMGESAATLIMEKINDPFAASKAVTLDAKLIYRASTLGITD